MAIYDLVIALDKQRNAKPKPLDYRSGRRDGLIILARIPGVGYQVSNFLVYDFHICKIPTNRPVVEEKKYKNVFFYPATDGQQIKKNQQLIFYLPSRSLSGIL